MTGIGWQWAFVFYSLLIFIWSYYWNKYGVGIVPGQVERCTKEEAAYLQGREIPEGEEPDGPPPFDFTIWWAVVKQPVTCTPATTPLTPCRSVCFSSSRCRRGQGGWRSSRSSPVLASRSS